MDYNLYPKNKIEQTDTKVTPRFQICTIMAKTLQNLCSVQVDTMDSSLSSSTPMDLLNATEDSHRVTQCR